MEHLHPPSLVRQLAESWPPAGWRDCHVLVALSGGADSVALLRGLLDLAGQTPGAGGVLAAHFNHRLRPGEADDDAVWVSRLCAELGVRLTLGRADEPGSLDSEAEAREARYAFLAQTAESAGARYVATAHTADDQVETVLMRVLRGSGIAGLAGIPFARPLTPAVTLVRPLLSTRREVVESYLASLAQPFRTDSTNFRSQFTRNWIRRELLPLVRERLPGDVDAAVLRLAQQAGEWSAALDELVEGLTADGMETTSEQIVLDRRTLASQPAIVVQEACRRAWREAGWPEQAMGMEAWRRLAAAIAADEFAAFLLPGSVEVRQEEGDVVLRRA